MSEVEETSETGGNLTAVQSISAKLLEVTRLAEKLDAKLCEAGARSQPLNPAGEDDEEISTKDEDVRSTKINVQMPTKVEIQEPAVTEEKSEKSEQEHVNREATSRSTMDELTVEDYVTATECTTTPVPRSRSESFLSSEYEDAPISTTCRKTEDDSTKKNELLTVAKSENVVSTNPTDQEVIEYSPDGATVIQRTIQEKGGKVVREVTETTTLRVSHNTHMGVASYKLVSNTIQDHTDNLDYRELQDLNRLIVDGCSTTPPPIPLKTHREEHTYTSPNKIINYMKSTAKGMNGHVDTLKNGDTMLKQKNVISVREERNSELTSEEKEFLNMISTVSEDLNECTRDTPTTVSIQQISCQQNIKVACMSAAEAVTNTIVEELSIMPTAIAVCEFN